MKRAFTLIEILIVITFLVILGALLFPELASAKRNAHRATCLSNLRQCGTAMVLYAGENDGKYPEIDVAAEQLRNTPTCDPEDSWRRTCSEKWGDPLVGSYAYFKGLAGFKGPEGQARWSPESKILFVSIFYAEPVPKPFHGESADAKFGLNLMPRKGVIRLNSELSAYPVNHWYMPSGDRIYINWVALFTDDMDSQYIKIH